MPLDLLELAIIQASHESEHYAWIAEALDVDDPEFPLVAGLANMWADIAHTLAVGF